MVAMETAAASQGQHGSTSLPSGDPGAEDTTRSSLHLSPPHRPSSPPSPGLHGAAPREGESGCEPPDALQGLPVFQTRQQLLGQHGARPAWKQG